MTTARRTAYFDWNASAPLRVEAREAMVRAMDFMGNPSSTHEPGRASRRVIDDAREAVARTAGTKNANVIFTSGAAEANGLALRGLIQHSAEKGERITRLIISAIEHSSVLATADALEQQIPGLKVSRLPVSNAGVIDLDALRLMLMSGKGRALIALMLANNETGVIQPVAEASRVAKEHGALMLCDAVQGLNRLPLEFDAWNLDAMTLSAHKAGGPKGIGALILREGLALSPQILGGGQEFGLRAGTQNLTGIAGFGAAAALGRNESELTKTRAMRDRIQKLLLAACPSARVFGGNADRLPNTICIALPGLTSETQVMALDLDGFAVSAGSACSSGKVKASGVLTAMGASEELARCAIRISLGPDNTDAECDALIAAWTKLATRNRARSAA